MVKQKTVFLQCEGAVSLPFVLSVPDTVHETRRRRWGGGGRIKKKYAVLGESCLCTEGIPDPYMRNIRAFHMLQSDIHCYS